MKRLLIALIVIAFMSAGMALAEVKQPQLPVGLDNFVLVADEQWECGLAEKYEYITRNADWVAIFLDHSKFTNPLVVVKYNAEDDSMEVWIDNNRDGVFDEHYTDEEAIYQKYPEACDAVK